MSLTLDRLKAASGVLSKLLPPSPLLLAARSGKGGALWLKCESLQPTGSFKIRGASYRISTLTPEERAAGVVAYSTGNHAQAVAKAAADQGVKATIVMSADVPEAKVSATRRWGAQVIMAAPTSKARKMLAEGISAESGAVLIPPYDDFDVMAGQGSIAFELQRQLPDLKQVVVYVPIGGGGLIAGVAAAMKAIEPTARVIGVEPELEADALRSFESGSIYAADGPSASIADAIKVQALGELTFPIIRAHVDAIVTVSEGEIRAATLNLFDEHKLVVEPGGAVGYAAARRTSLAGERRIALLCGGNIALEKLDALRRAS